LWVAVASCTSEARIGGDERSALEAGSVATTDATIPTATVGGRYSLIIKSGANGCAFETWTEGSLGVADVVFAQTGTSIAARLEGVAAFTHGLLVGSTTFAGSVTGNTITFLGVGTIERTIEGCAYTVDARVTARAEEDALEGVLLYERNVGNRPECARFACASRVTLTGLRSDVDASVADAAPE